MVSVWIENKIGREIVMRDKPILSYDTIKRMEDMSFFTHAQIFDDLLAVSQKETTSYVWKTSDGLVVFDGIWPDEAAYNAIITAISDIGWDPKDIRKFIITHGHIDHVGCGKWLVQNHHAKTYMSQVDDVLRKSQSHEEGRSDSWKVFDIDVYVKDDDVISCGDKNVFVVGTPGHTLGCMSYIFPVADQGEVHMAAIFGGATPPWGDDEETRVHRQSIEKFLCVAKDKHVDVALSNHTAFDNGIERIEYSKVRMAYMPNVYVLGEDGFERFCSVYSSIIDF